MHRWAFLVVSATLCGRAWAATTTVLMEEHALDDIDQDGANSKVEIVGKAAYLNTWGSDCLCSDPDGGKDCLTGKTGKAACLALTDASGTQCLWTGTGATAPINTATPIGMQTPWKSAYCPEQEPAILAHYQANAQGAWAPDPHGVWTPTTASADGVDDIVGNVASMDTEAEKIYDCMLDPSGTGCGAVTTDYVGPELLVTEERTAECSCKYAGCICDTSIKFEEAPPLEYAKLTVKAFPTDFDREYEFIDYIRVTNFDGTESEIGSKCMEERNPAWFAVCDEAQMYTCVDDILLAYGVCENSAGAANDPDCEHDNRAACDADTDDGGGGACSWDSSDGSLYYGPACSGIPSSASDASRCALQPNTTACSAVAGCNWGFKRLAQDLIELFSKISPNVNEEQCHPRDVIKGKYLRMFVYLTLVYKTHSERPLECSCNYPGCTCKTKVQVSTKAQHQTQDTMWQMLSAQLTLTNSDANVHYIKRIELDDDSLSQWSETCIMDNTLYASDTGSILRDSAFSWADRTAGKCAGTAKPCITKVVANNGESGNWDHKDVTNYFVLDGHTGTLEFRATAPDVIVTEHVDCGPTQCSEHCNAQRADKKFMVMALKYDFTYWIPYKPRYLLRLWACAIASTHVSTALTPTICTTDCETFVGAFYEHGMLEHWNRQVNMGTGVITTASSFCTNYAAAVTCPGASSLWSGYPEPPTQDATKCRMEHHYDYEGNNVAALDGATVIWDQKHQPPATVNNSISAISAAHCCNKCRQRAREGSCVSWTYVPGENLCYFKDQMQQGRKMRRSYWSGYPEEGPHTKRIVTPLPQQHEDAVSFVPDTSYPDATEKCFHGVRLTDAIPDQKGGMLFHQPINVRDKWSSTWQARFSYQSKECKITYRMDTSDTELQRICSSPAFGASNQPPGSVSGGEGFAFVIHNNAFADACASASGSKTNAQCHSDHGSDKAACNADADCQWDGATYFVEDACYAGSGSDHSGCVHAGQTACELDDDDGFGGACRWGILGSSGSGLGYEGMPNTIAVKFGFRPVETNGVKGPLVQHICVHSGGFDEPVANSALHRVSVCKPFDFETNYWYTFKVEYTTTTLGEGLNEASMMESFANTADSYQFIKHPSGALCVYVKKHDAHYVTGDDTDIGTSAYNRLCVAMSVPNTIKLHEEHLALVGFTASTGDHFQKHDIRRWELQFEEPWSGV